jgi:HEAT repeat protein
MTRRQELFIALALLIPPAFLPLNAESLATLSQRCTSRGGNSCVGLIKALERCKDIPDCIASLDLLPDGALSGISSNQNIDKSIRSQSDTLLATRPDTAKRIDAATDSFGRHGPQTVTLLVALLSRAPSADARYEAAEDLYGFSEPIAIDALVKATNDPDAKVRDEAAFSLENSNSPQALAAIVDFLRHPDPQIRSSAASAITHQWFTALRVSDLRATAATSLIAIVQDPGETAEGRFPAIQALGAIQDKRAIGPLIQLVKNPGHDSQPDAYGIRQTAVTALGDIGDAEAVETLVEVLNRGGNLRGDAALALAKINDPEGVQAVLALAAQNDPDVIEDIRDALVLIGRPELEDVLINALARLNSLSIAQTMIVSGNPRLEKAATEWAAAHNVEVMPFATPSSFTWGSPHR